MEVKVVAGVENKEDQTKRKVVVAKGDQNQKIVRNQGVNPDQEAVAEETEVQIVEESR